MNQSSETLRKPYFILREVGAVGLCPWVDIKDAGTEPVRGPQLPARQVLTSERQLLRECVLEGPTPQPTAGTLPVPVTRDRKGDGIGALQGLEH